MSERPGAYGRDSTYFPADTSGWRRRFHPNIVDEYHLQCCTGCHRCVEEN